jgi:hypothetical protein
MDVITTGIIASAAYDILKRGAQLSAGVLRDRLGKWIKEEVLADALATELRKLDINEDLSELAINRRLESAPQLPALIKEINAKAGLIASSTVTTVTQTHSGSGDNVAGNKITH